MSLDIGIADSRLRTLVRDEPMFSLDDDGYYWFLHPFFEKLRAETGQYIDLYGIASFQGDERTALARMLAEVRALVEAKPDSWVGYDESKLQPVYEEIPKPVKRLRFLELLTHWQIIVDRALELDRAVLCIGD